MNSNRSYVGAFQTTSRHEQRLQPCKPDAFECEPWSENCNVEGISENLTTHKIIGYVTGRHPPQRVRVEYTFQPYTSWHCRQFIVIPISVQSQVLSRTLPSWFTFGQPTILGFLWNSVMQAISCIYEELSTNIYNIMFVHVWDKNRPSNMSNCHERYLLSFHHLSYSLSPSYLGWIMFAHISLWFIDSINICIRSVMSRFMSVCSQ